MARGILLEWTDSPPPFNTPFDSAKSFTGRPVDVKACRNLLRHHLDIGSVRPLADQNDACGVWSAFFSVPKKGTDKVRGCTDLNTINPYLRYEHFKTEGLHTVQVQLRRRDHMWQINMSDFYPLADRGGGPLVLPISVRHQLRMSDCRSVHMA